MWSDEGAVTTSHFIYGAKVQSLSVLEQYKIKDKPDMSKWPNHIILWLSPNQFELSLLLDVNHIIVLFEQLGKAIKAQRKSLRITQPHLAELSGVSTNWLSAFEKGKSNPTLGTLEKITEVLGMKVRLYVKSPTHSSWGRLPYKGIDYVTISYYYGSAAKDNVSSKG